MFQDKLTQAQRIRLEAVAQASALQLASRSRLGITVEILLDDARQIEAYITGQEGSDGE